MGNEVNLLEGVYISLSSMSLVFIILLIISLVLGSFKHIFKENNNKKDLASESNSQSNKELALTDEEDEEKVVVALAASIIAGKGKVNPNLHIKSITRIK
ncbi:OadG family transporter subunit [Faecalimicrobium sp. JNUCC 81]